MSGDWGWLVLILFHPFIRPRKLGQYPFWRIIVDHVDCLKQNPTAFSLSVFFLWPVASWLGLNFDLKNE
jgi:hypothetical protein